MTATGLENEIAFSRIKILLLTIGSFAFVGAGLWFLSKTPEEIAAVGDRYPPVYVYVVGWLAVGFFGLCGVGAILKFFDRRPGVRFTPEGITANSMYFSA